MSRLYCDPRSLAERLGRPLVLGHRGLPGDRVENRIAAFEGALALGADGVELDVQLSSDGVPVVCHDSRLERTTGQPGRLSDHAAAELEALGIPQLAAVLDALSPEAIINIELKAPRVRGYGLEQAVVAVLREHGAEGRVLFSSFNPWALWRVRRIDARFYAAQLSAPIGSPIFRLAYLARPGAVHPHVSEVTPAALGAWRKQGQPVIVWGDKNVQELALVLQADVDGVITDRPREAFQMLTRWG